MAYLSGHVLGGKVTFSWVESFSYGLNYLVLYPPIHLFIHTLLFIPFQKDYDFFFFLMPFKLVEI